MWRTSLTLFVLLFLTGSSFGITYMYYPVSEEITDGGVVYIGDVGPSHLVRLIFNAEIPSKILEVSADYPITYTISSGRLFVDFNAPASEGNYSVNITLRKEAGYESFWIAFNVREKILEVSADGKVNIPEAGSGKARVIIVNPGAGSTEVIIWSSFPSSKERKFVPAHEVVEASLTLHSIVSGEYREVIYVKDLRSGEVYEVPINVNVYPTLLGRIRIIYVFPEVAFPILYPIRLLLGVVFWRM